MSNENVLILTNESFKDLIANSETPILVDFWAPGCGPCRMLAPVIDEIASEFEGRAKVGKINIDEEAALAEEYKVMTIPTVAVFVNGQLVDKTIGVVSKTDLTELLEKNL